jgi:hypothetical protein
MSHYCSIPDDGDGGDEAISVRSCWVVVIAEVTIALGLGLGLYGQTTPEFMERNRTPISCSSPSILGAIPTTQPRTETILMLVTNANLSNPRGRAVVVCSGDWDGWRRLYFLVSDAQ